MNLHATWKLVCPEPIGPWEQLWLLRQAGVSSDQLLDIGAGGISITRERWRLQTCGTQAYILPVIAPSGGLIDLVAFSLETPRSSWLMTGDGIVLGVDSLERSACLQKPLLVHESPVDWLKAGRVGIVILDWRHYWPALLAGVPVLRSRDLRFGQKLRAMLKHPLPIPPIEVAA